MRYKGLSDEEDLTLFYDWTQFDFWIRNSKRKCM